MDTIRIFDAGKYKQFYVEILMDILGSLPTELLSMWAKPPLNRNQWEPLTKFSAYFKNIPT